MNENRGLSPAPPMFRHKHASIKFGRFCGDNPEAWIFQAKHYFEFYEIVEKYKLSFASLYLDGEALEWYRWLFQNKQLADWKHFTAKVMIQFRKQHKSQRCHLLNSGQLTSVIDYQSHFEDASLGYGDFNVLTPDIAYVSPQWSDITNSPLLQCCDEQSEGNNKTNMPKVFDDLSETSKDTSSIDISCKLSQLEVEDPHKVCKLTIRYTTEAYFSNDLAYYVSPTAEETDCDNEAKSEDKNDEEEIVTIRDENFYPQHELELAQFWKKMFPIPSTCNYPMIITRGITSRVLILNLFSRYQFGLEFPFDPDSSFLIMYNLVRMRGHWDNIQNNLFACSRDNSNPIDNLEVPSEMFELSFDVEHEKLKHMDTYLSVGCLEPLPIPTEIVVGDDFATEAIDRVTTYLKGGKHHMFYGFAQKKGLIYFQVALLHIQLDPSLADFRGLALCESMKNGLPTCYWFDTGQHVCHSIPFLFRHKICDYYLSAMEFDKNGYRPIIGA
ncbi:hypothetical protein H5410_052346 [Solanum commersonii]|uniref:Retrotransposon gag domain-containing protein n=1 Tax=Solanum commersonii TaxID=4109 RepID=A0A9J5X1Z0_SOLCO|nr:hypothetical protein H5410_052346 [Solanum commersonii]